MTVLFRPRQLQHGTVLTSNRSKGVVYNDKNVAGYKMIHQTGTGTVEWVQISHSDECPCGTGPQIPNHILQSCPTFDALRRQTWPSPVDAHRKLWGPVETLRYTDYSTPFAVNRSLSESMQSSTHIECSSDFLPQPLLLLFACFVFLPVSSAPSVSSCLDLAQSWASKKWNEWKIDRSWLDCSFSIYKKD